MAPPPKHVLRLRRTDNKSAHFLVHVAQEGRNELDLKLIGTDKSELYVVSLTAADTKSYQDRNFNGSEEDFQTLLKFSFLHYRSDAILPASLQGVETVAAINGPTASITIRKNVDGITQRLGTIHLQENTSHTEIDTFDWVEAATAEADELRSQLDGLQISVESQKNSIAKLTTELDMLVRAKKAHEDDLLSKFAALLNAKKLKIRDQQRLLNGAQIDPVAATEVSNARLSRTTRKAGASRSGKRKAKATPSRALDGEQEESEEAIAEEDHTMNGSEEDTSRHDQVTPEPDHADAATESEDEEVPKPAAAARRSQNTQERRAERMNVGEKKSPTGATSLRKLPSRAARDSTPPVAADVDDEDEETDDEL